MSARLQVCRTMWALALFLGIAQAALGKLAFNRGILDPFEEFVFVPAFMSATKNGSSSCVALETSRINDHRLFNYSRTETTSIYTETTVNYSSVLYTLKDGYPRLNLIPTNTITNTYTTVSGIFQPYPTRHPDCDIRTELSCRKCTVHGGMDVQLIYWGNTNETKSSNWTATLTDAPPVTAILNGTTLTSPSVYLSYGKIGVFDGCGVNFLHTYTNILVTLPPGALSSLEQDDKENIVTRSFNLGDLTDPIPASPYLHQITCAVVNNTNDCLPIPPLSRYSPVVAVPSEIFSLDPYFKSCDLYFRGAWDPPRILVPAKALASTSAVEANLPAPTIKPGTSPKPFEPAITADPQPTLSPSPVPKSASNGDISGNSLTANKDLNANDPSAKDLAIENSPVSNDVSNAGLPSAAPDLASRTIPVVVEAALSISSQIHDPNRASIITDHIPPTLFPSANAAPTPVPQLLPATLDDQTVVFNNALSQSLNSGKEPDLLTSSIPLASAKVIGSKTLSFPPSLKIEGLSTILPAFNFGGKPIYPNSASEYIINDQTLIAGAPAITVSGTRLSIAPLASALFIGTNTIPIIISSPKPLPTLTIGDITITPNAATQYIVNGQTMIPGGPAITLFSTSISLAQDVSALFIGTNTILITTPPLKSPPSLTIGDLTITPNSASQYIVNGQTLIPGGPAITLSSTSISLAQDVSALFIGTNTIPLTSPPLKPSATLTIGDLIITPNSASQYILNSQTLIPGGPAITLSNTRLSLADDASTIIIGTNTIHLTAPSPKLLPTLTIGDLTITPNAASQYNINGQTLIPGGPAITLSSTRLFLAGSASVLVVGTKTSTLFTHTTDMVPDSEQGADLGIVILKGLGIQSTSSIAIIPATYNNKSESGIVANNSTALGPAEVFRGDGSRQRRFFSLRTTIMLLGFCVLKGLEI